MEKRSGEPVSTVLGEEAPGHCGDQGRPLPQRAVGRDVVREGSSGGPLFFKVFMLQDQFHLE